MSRDFDDDIDWDSVKPDIANHQQKPFSLSKSTYQPGAVQRFQQQKKQWRNTLTHHEQAQHVTQTNTRLGKTPQYQPQQTHRSDQSHNTRRSNYRSHDSHQFKSHTQHSQQSRLPATRTSQQPIQNLQKDDPKEKKRRERLRKAAEAKQAFQEKARKKQEEANRKQMPNPSSQSQSCMDNKQHTRHNNSSSFSSSERIYPSHRQSHFSNQAHQQASSTSSRSSVPITSQNDTLVHPKPKRKTPANLSMPSKSVFSGNNSSSSSRPPRNLNQGGSSSRRPPPPDSDNVVGEMSDGLMCQIDFEDEIAAELREDAPIFGNQALPRHCDANRPPNPQFQQKFKSQFEMRPQPAQRKQTPKKMTQQTLAMNSVASKDVIERPPSPLNNDDVDFNVNLYNNMLREQGASFPLLDRKTAGSWVYPMSDKYTERKYQFDIVKIALYENTLVCLPTGLGKTFIAAVLIYNFYRWYPEGKLLFIGPTKPLVAQQVEACYKVNGIPQSETAHMDGHKSVEKRRVIWQNHRLLFCTPQIVKNDINQGFVDVNSFVCVIVDEAHRASKRYAFVEVVKELGVHTRVVGLSATPGSDLNHIKNVIRNLRASRLDVRFDDDPEIQKFSHKKELEVLLVKQTAETSEVARHLERLVRRSIKYLSDYKVMFHVEADKVARFTLITQQKQFQKSPPPGIPKETIFDITGQFGLAIALVGGRDQLKNYGLNAFVKSITNALSGNVSKAKRYMSLDLDYRSMIDLSKAYLKDGFIHPKLQKLRELVVDHFEEKENSRVIVFCSLRESVHEMTNMLNQIGSKIRATEFVGQQSNKKRVGQTQKHQQKIVEEFRKGNFNVLVSTCIGEEGLDIGEVDLIVNYDTISSPIRTVQRMGRTGRKRDGRCVMLVAEGNEQNKYKRSVSEARLIKKKLHSPKELHLGFEPSPRMLPKSFWPICEKKQLDIKIYVRPQKKGRIKSKTNDLELTEKERAMLQEYLLSREEADIVIDNFDTSKPEITRRQSTMSPIHLIGHSSLSYAVAELLRLCQDPETAISRHEKRVEKYGNVVLEQLTGESDQAMSPDSDFKDDMSTASRKTPKKHPKGGTKSALMAAFARQISKDDTNESCMSDVEDGNGGQEAEDADSSIAHLRPDDTYAEEAEQLDMHPIEIGGYFDEGPLGGLHENGQTTENPSSMTKLNANPVPEAKAEPKHKPKSKRSARPGAQAKHRATPHANPAAEVEPVIRTESVKRSVEDRLDFRAGVAEFPDVTRGDSNYLGSNAGRTDDISIDDESKTGAADRETETSEKEVRNKGKDEDLAPIGGINVGNKVDLDDTALPNVHVFPTPEMIAEHADAQNPLNLFTPDVNYLKQKKLVDSINFANEVIEFANRSTSASSKPIPLLKIPELPLVPLPPLPQRTKLQPKTSRAIKKPTPPKKKSSNSRDRTPPKTSGASSKTTTKQQNELKKSQKKSKKKTSNTTKKSKAKKTSPKPQQTLSELFKKKEKKHDSVDSHVKATKKKTVPKSKSLRPPKNGAEPGRRSSSSSEKSEANTSLPEKNLKQNEENSESKKEIGVLSIGNQKKKVRKLNHHSSNSSSSSVCNKEITNTSVEVSAKSKKFLIDLSQDRNGDVTSVSDLRIKKKQKLHPSKNLSENDSSSGNMDHAQLLESKTSTEPTVQHSHSSKIAHSKTSKSGSKTSLNSKSPKFSKATTKRSPKLSGNLSFKLQKHNSPNVRDKRQSKHTSHSEPFTKVKTKPNPNSTLSAKISVSNDYPLRGSQSIPVADRSFKTPSKPQQHNASRQARQEESLSSRNERRTKDRSGSSRTLPSSDHGEEPQQSKTCPICKSGNISWRRDYKCKKCLRFHHAYCIPSAGSSPPNRKDWTCEKCFQPSNSIQETTSDPYSTKKSTQCEKADAEENEFDEFTPPDKITLPPKSGFETPTPKLKRKSKRKRKVIMETPSPKIRMTQRKSQNCSSSTNQVSADLEEAAFSQTPEIRRKSSKRRKVIVLSPDISQTQKPRTSQSNNNPVSPNKSPPASPSYSQSSHDSDHTSPLSERKFKKLKKKRMKSKNTKAKCKQAPESPESPMFNTQLRQDARKAAVKFRAIKNACMDQEAEVSGTDSGDEDEMGEYDMDSFLDDRSVIDDSSQVVDYPHHHLMPRHFTQQTTNIADLVRRPRGHRPLRLIGDDDGYEDENDRNYEGEAEEVDDDEDEEDHRLADEDLENDPDDPIIDFGVDSDDDEEGEGGFDDEDSDDLTPNSQANMFDDLTNIPGTGAPSSRFKTPKPKKHKNIDSDDDFQTTSTQKSKSSRVPKSRNKHKLAPSKQFKAPKRVKTTAACSQLSPSSEGHFARAMNDFESRHSVPESVQKTKHSRLQRPARKISLRSPNTITRLKRRSGVGSSLKSSNKSTDQQKASKKCNQSKWSCTACTLLNPPQNLCCEVCETPRQNVPKKPPQTEAVSKHKSKQSSVRTRENQDVANQNQEQDTSESISSAADFVSAAAVLDEIDSKTSDPPPPLRGAGRSSDCDRLEIIVSRTESSRHGAVSSTLRRIHGVKNHVMKMPFGHYIVSLEAVVVRVALKDLADRLKFPKLTNEIMQLLDKQFRRAYIIVQEDEERSENFDRVTGRQDRLDLSLEDLDQISGVLVEKSQSYEQSAHRILNIARTEAEMKGPLCVPSSISRGSNKKDLDFLANIPCLNIAEAIALLHGFNYCISDIINSSIDEISVKSGVSKFKAKLIHKHFRNPNYSRRNSRI